MNLMQSIKPIVRACRAADVKRRLSTGCITPCAWVAVFLASSLLVAAQETNAPAQTNNITEPEVLSQLGDLVQAADPGETEAAAPPNGLPQAKGSVASGDRAPRVNRFDNAGRGQDRNSSQDPGRSQRDDRRFRGRRSFRSNSERYGSYGSANDYSSGSDLNPTNALSEMNNSLVTLDYADFRIIVDRNIFDPNRVSRHGSRLNLPQRIYDSLTLVGTMTYEKGTFAFFDGTSAQYKKALRVTDAIAGYKVTAIAPNSVKLASGTNQLELNVGAQLRREEDGPWELAGTSASYEAMPSSSSTNATSTTSTAVGSDAAASGQMSDVLKRLMQRREKE